ncbi:Hypothetical predicted protein [Xyrichtys novacula]|uniref:Uncharacterized protein n=1 Tax=Xyrichtys novacula TaxID=13765 RepID=A0AAV1F794_XYRNO|nr:Hypothetical predicted protein [Xyrichtys novacula]
MTEGRRSENRDVKAGQNWIVQHASSNSAERSGSENRKKNDKHNEPVDQSYRISINELGINNDIYTKNNKRCINEFYYFGFQERKYEKPPQIKPSTHSHDKDTFDHWQGICLEMSQVSQVHQPSSKVTPSFITCHQRSYHRQGHYDLIYMKHRAPSELTELLNWGLSISTQAVCMNDEEPHPAAVHLELLPFQHTSEPSHLFTPEACASG